MPNNMPTIALRSACAFASEVLLRFVIAGTGLRPCDTTRPGVFEYDTIEPSQWAAVSELQVDLHRRKLIVDYARDKES